MSRAPVQHPAPTADSAYEAFRGTRYFGSLDGLRALGVLMVISYHVLGHELAALSRGFHGVTVFFALSGFLITTLLLREREQAGRISLSGFYLRRSLRIFPLYYAVLAVYTALVLWKERGSPAGAQFLQNLPAFATYTSNWFVDLSQGKRIIFYFAWSLATEEQFYLVWPGVIALAGRRLQPVLVMALLLAANLAASGMVHAGLLDGTGLGMRILLSVQPSICLGSLAAYALHSPGGFRLAHALLGHRWSPAVAAALSVALMVPVLPTTLPLSLALVALVVACCIQPAHVLAPLLQCRPARYLGAVSYGLYLLHMLALNVVRRALPGLSAPLVLAATLALTLVLAALSQRFLEQPALRLKRLFTPAAAPQTGALPLG